MELCSFRLRCDKAVGRHSICEPSRRLLRPIGQPAATPPWPNQSAPASSQRMLTNRLLVKMHRDLTQRGTNPDGGGIPFYYGDKNGY